MTDPLKIGYDIEKSKSDKSRCCFCREIILDDFRLKNFWANRFCHIKCSGFTFSKLMEMNYWNALNLTKEDLDYIASLVRKY